MNGRLPTLAGPVFAIVFLVAVALEGNVPNEKSSGAKVISYFNDHDTSTLSGAFGGPVLALLLLLFFSQLRAVARASALGAGPGPTVMIGGAVVWAGGLLIGSWLDLAVVASAKHHQEGVAQTLNVLIASNWIPYIAGIAVTLVGAGMTVLSTGVLPRWLGWVALVVGIIALAGPGGFLGFFVAPLWILVAGIVLLRAEMTAEPATV
jgi:hypothetical protein